jgi:hypothetical protein
MKKKILFNTLTASDWRRGCGKRDRQTQKRSLARRLGVDQWQTKKLPTAVSWTVDLSLALYDDISHDCTQVSTARFTELEIEVKVIVQIFSSLEL